MCVCGILYNLLFVLDICNKNIQFKPYCDCIVEANFIYKSKCKPFNDVTKENIINNEEL